MIVRRFEPTDHQTFCLWMNTRKMGGIERDALPETGFVAEHDGVPVAMSFVYQTDSLAAIMGWTATDPSLKIGIKTRGHGVRLVIKACTDQCKQWGMKHVFHFSSSHGLTSSLKKQGFLVSALNHSLCVRGVSDGS